MRAAHFLCSLLVALPALAQPRSVPMPDSERTRWFRDAKFGIFVHWGPYSVIGRHEWARHKLQIPQPEYDRFARQFNPVKFNASEWTRLFQNAGAKYIVITSKHHDGFSIYRSGVSNYDMEITPYSADPLKQLAEAAQRSGLRLGFYHSIMDWKHPDYRPLRSWEHPKTFEEGGDLPRYLDYMRGQLRELLTNYGEVATIWFDGEWEHKPEEINADGIYEFIRTLQPNTLINDRLYNRRPGNKADFGTPEQYVPATGVTGADGKPLLWESCVTINGDSWGYNKYETDFKTERDLIRMLIEVVSKGGNLLLNVGPRPDGTIQPEFVYRLEAIGRWMNVNAEAIYETAASPFPRLPFYGRATVKGSTVFLHVFNWPKDGKLRVPGLNNIVYKAYLLLDRNTQLTTARDGDDVIVTVPAVAPDDTASVIALQLDGTPQVKPSFDVPGQDGTLVLSAAAAEIESSHGQRLKMENIFGHAYLTRWTRPEDVPVWTLNIPKSGRYSVSLRYAAARASKDLPFFIKSGDALLRGKTEVTGDAQVFKDFAVGILSLKAGRQTLQMQSNAPPGAPAMNLEALLLTPAK
ncbi:MAG: alpha-L-fucosidase [Bryobacterales bacterium]|nr:alpha-L-fucosidase [Bryobacterales bacterium]